MPWLLAMCLLLKAGVPMLAAAAAQLRGVGVAEVCPVYGVALLPTSAQLATAHRAMPAMASDAAREHLHESAHAGRADQRALADRRGDHGHDHHGDLAASHDHCALSPLLGAAALATGPTPIVGAVAQAEPRSASPSFAATVHDRALAWYARDAHPPPG